MSFSWVQWTVAFVYLSNFRFHFICNKFYTKCTLSSRVSDFVILKLWLILLNLLLLLRKTTNKVIFYISDPKLQQSLLDLMDSIHHNYMVEMCKGKKKIAISNRPNYLAAQIRTNFWSFFRQKVSQIRRWKRSKQVKFKQYLCWSWRNVFENF